MEGRETAIGLPPDLEAPSLRSGSLRSPSLRCGSSNSAVFNSIRLPLVVLMKVGIFLRPYSNCRWRRCLTDIGTEGSLKIVKRCHCRDVTRPNKASAVRSRLCTRPGRRPPAELNNQSHDRTRAALLSCFASAHWNSIYQRTGNRTADTT